MSCCSFSGLPVGTVLAATIENCSICIKDQDGNVIRSFPLCGADISYDSFNDVYLLTNGGKPLSLSSDQIVEFGLTVAEFTQAVKDCACGSSDLENDIEYVGITTTVYCRISDGKKVIIRTCKLEDGSIELTDTDSGATLTDATLASDYNADCEELKVVDLKETTIVIPLGATDSTVTPIMGYDAVEIFNSSPCPQLATVTLTDEDNMVTTHKVIVEPGERRVFDWDCDAVTDFVIGEAAPITVTTPSDNRTTQAATADLKARVTFFNS